MMCAYELIYAYRFSRHSDSAIWAAPWAVPAADQQTVVVQTSYGLVPIGWVQSALRVLDDATVGWTDRRSVCG